MGQRVVYSDNLDNRLKLRLYFVPKGYKSYAIDHNGSDEEKQYDNHEDIVFLSTDDEALKSLDGQSILEIFIGNQSFNDKTINPFKSQILSYLRENKITGNKLLQIGKKEFGDSLVIFSGDKKIRGAAIKTFDRFCKLDIDQAKDNEDEKKKYNNNDNDYTDKQIDMVSPSDAEGLLKLWGLERYIDILIIIIEHGWDDTEDWKDIESQYLKDKIGMKEGDANKFIRKTKELYQQ